MPSLTPDRTALLCASIKTARARTIGRYGSEHSLTGQSSRYLLIESILCGLVADLGGLEALSAVHKALGDDITSAEVTAEISAQAERQARYAAQAQKNALHTQQVPA